MTGRPDVSVVVPYYERPDQLDRLLAGLDAQTLAADRFELVVADDGSRVAPVTGERAYRTTVVRQHDKGFRAAAARNLGAAEATGTVLAFLDQDCVPAPDYLERVAAAARSPWALVVGHRLPADLDGWTGAAVSRWLAGAEPAPELLPEPQWLLDGYARTADLREPDGRAYQLVISAVLTLHRELFARLGGFDESFRDYGGEDWELAHRAVVAGADLAWLADAQAWHDGPDLAVREEGSGAVADVKNRETLSLARLVPDSDLRGRDLVWNQPDIVVELCVGAAGPAALMASVGSLLAGSDAHVWLDDGASARVLRAALDDPRVHVGRPGEALTRARYLVRCDPVVLEGTSLRRLTEVAPVAAPGLRVSRVRDEHRAARGLTAPADRPWPEGARVERFAEEPFLERRHQR